MILFFQSPARDAAPQDLANMIASLMLNQAAARRDNSQKL